MPAVIAKKLASTTKALLMASLVLLGLFSSRGYVSVSAAPTIPYKINFQGRLTNNSGNIVANGLYNIRFKIMNAPTAGTELWSETRQTSSRVQITNGLFDVRLGDVTPLSPTIFNSTTQLYLEVELPSPATATCATAACASYTEGPLSPRQPIAASPYAFNADMIDGIDGAQLARVDQGNTFIGNQVVSGSLAATTLQQGGNAVCDTSNNCNYATATELSNVILQGGNTMSAAITIGTNDNNALNLETNNAVRMTILGNGNIGINTTNPTHSLELAAGTTAAAGIAFGTDTELYRSAANTLALANGDSLNLVSGNLQIAGTTVLTSARVLQNVTANASIITAGTIANVRLTGSGSLTVTAGNGLSGGGAVALGGTTTLTVSAGDGITVSAAGVAVNSTVCRNTNNCNYAPATGSGSYINNGTVVQTANLAIQSAGASSVGAAIRASASQTADLLQLQNASSAAIAGVRQDGRMYGSAGIESNDYFTYGQLSVALTDLTTTMSTQFIQNSTSFSSGSIAIQGTSASVATAIFRANGTTGDTLQVRNSDNTNMFTVAKNGRLFSLADATVWGNARSTATLRDNSPLAAGVGAGLNFEGIYNSSGGSTIFGNIHAVKENAVSGDSSASLVFVTNPNNFPTERMRLNSSGNLSVGSASASARLAAVNNIATQHALLVQGSSGQTAATFSVQANGGAELLAVSSAGTLTVQPLAGADSIVVKDSGGNNVFMVNAAGKIVLGNGGYAFSGLKRITTTWNPPSTANASTSVNQYTMPAGAIVVGVVPPAPPACTGAFGCTYSSGGSLLDSRGGQYAAGGSSNQIVQFVFANATGAAVDPPNATWTIWYIEP